MNNIPLNEELLNKVTTRERQIIADLAEGLSLKEIAVRRGISVNTAEVHRHNILKKTGFKNSVALCVAYVKGGII